MDIDVAQLLGGVVRSVADDDREGTPLKVVRLERVFDAPAADVWDACTSAERLPRWFLPVSGDLRVGGRFHVEGNASGTVLECDPPRHLAVTWEYGDEVSWVDVRLDPADDAPSSTLLVLEHRVPESDHWRQFGPGAVGIGWEQALVGLGLHVAGAAALNPAEVVAWFASAEGRGFVAGTSDRWCAASMASGADAGWARAAADRTTAAYLGD